MLRPYTRITQCCSSCSSKLLKQWASSTPPQNLASAAARRPLPRPQQPAIRQTFSPLRAYSSLDKPSIPPETEREPEHDHEQDAEPRAEWEAENELAPEDSAEVNTSSTSEVPWYLEVEPPRHPTLIPQQYPLPEIPADSPKIMTPLVKFVSDELGIDRLTLLDLRTLDPPPALGPKLIMLFGSARMERHLHVSADRLVRWLAGQGLSATADGLMTRNELKLKMRRAARRAKTMAMAGGQATGNEALATSWICVNLGTTGWSAQEVEIKDAKGRVAGFGSPQTGTTIVVQLFTEAKRKELDLETLWGKQLERSDKIAAQIAGVPKPPRPADPFLEAFGDAAMPNRKTRRHGLQKTGF